MPIDSPQPQESATSLKGLVVGVVFLLIVLGVLVVIGAKTIRKAPQPPVPPAAPNTGTMATPVPITVVSDEGQKAALRSYFVKASPNNFKEEFMANVPVEAVGAYNEFVKSASGEAKLSAARNFFIYLNNPAVNRTNPQALAFLADVKADLGKTVGQALF